MGVCCGLARGQVQWQEGAGTHDYVVTSQLLFRGAGGTRWPPQKGFWDHKLEPPALLRSPVPGSSHHSLPDRCHLTPGPWLLASHSGVNKQGDGQRKAASGREERASGLH